MIDRQTMYTDGSYSESTDTTGAGVHGSMNGQVLVSDLLPIKSGSNNVGELSAIWLAFYHTVNILDS